MEECRVADDGYHPLGDTSLCCTVSLANAGPHATAGVHGRQGRRQGQRVAADIARHRHLSLVQQMEYAAMGTTRAENGRAWRDLWLVQLCHRHAG